MITEGIGEKFIPYTEGINNNYVLLLNQGFALSTREVFQKYELTNKAVGTNLNSEFKFFGPIGLNELYSAALSLKPELSEGEELISKVARGPYGFSGSGPTFWALFDSLESAREAEAKIKSRVFWTGVCSIA
jgi:4-diphosphocytidyl-2C-methyl-D-erythritol kinase